VGLFRRRRSKLLQVRLRGLAGGLFLHPLLPPNRKQAAGISEDKAERNPVPVIPRLLNRHDNIRIIRAETRIAMVTAGRLSTCSNPLLHLADEGTRHRRAARRVVVTPADPPVEDTAAGRQAVATELEQTAAGRQAVVIAAGHRAAAIGAVTPEAVREVDRPAAEEALPLRAGTLRQDTVAVDSSPAGSRPAPSHRSPAGGSERSLLLALKNVNRAESCCS
jgi:hypothetical protein